MTLNAHTHLYSGLVPLGMPRPQREPGSFREILETVWWRLDRALDEDSLRASARHYLAEAWALGTTAVVDHHESPNFIEGSLDVLADVCEEFGMKALLCYGATERNGGRDEARRGLSECRRFILSNRRPGIRGAIGLHAAFTVSDETIADAVELAHDLGAPLHLHVAEDRIDLPGFARLLEHGALIRGSIFAHGVHLTAEQVRLCSAAGVWLVQNPRSNRGNHVGYPAFLADATLVALGTDGYPSDLGAEADVLREQGESEEEIARRMAGGERLGEETFRVIPSVARDPGGRAVQPPGVADLHPLEIRDQAASRPPGSLATLGMTREQPPDFRADAARLWEKMKCIR